MVREHLNMLRDWRTNFKFRPATWVTPENKLQSDLTDFYMYVLPFHISYAYFEYFFHNYESSKFRGFNAHIMLPWG